MRKVAIFILTAACVAGAARTGLAGEAAAGDEFSDRIDRLSGPAATGVKVTADTWKGIIAKHSSGAEIKVPIDQVKDVEYSAAPQALRDGKRRAKGAVFSKAITDFESAQAAVNDQPLLKQYVLYNLGYCYLYRGQQGDLAKSREQFDKLLREIPETRFIFQSMLYRADTYYYEQNWDAAKKAYEDARAKFDSLGRQEPSVQKHCQRQASEAEYWGVRVAEARKDFAAAKSLYQRLEVGTDDPDIKNKARAGIGRCYLALAQYKEAKALYQKMIDEASKSGDSEILGQAYCGLGDCFYEEKDYSRARWNYLKVIVRYFQEREYVAKAHFFAGRCYERLSEKERDAAKWAKRHFTKVVEEYPESVWKDEADKARKRIGG